MALPLRGFCTDTVLVMPTLLDGTTAADGAQGSATVQTNDDRGVLYVSGLNTDTVDLEYRPSDAESFVPVETGVSSDGLTTIDPLPTGDYRATVSGPDDSPTVRLLPR